MGEGAGKSRAEEELDRIGQCVIDLSPDWVLSYMVSYPWVEGRCWRCGEGAPSPMPERERKCTLARWVSQPRSEAAWSPVFLCLVTYFSPTIGSGA